MSSYKSAAISLAAFGAAIYGVEREDTFLAEGTTNQIEEQYRNLDDTWDEDYLMSMYGGMSGWEEWNTANDYWDYSDWNYNDEWQEDREDTADAVTGVAVRLLIIVILIPICICVGVGVCI